MISAFWLSNEETNWDLAEEAITVELLQTKGISIRTIIPVTGEKIIALQNMEQIEHKGKNKCCRAGATMPSKADPPIPKMASELYAEVQPLITTRNSGVGRDFVMQI